MTVKLNGKDYVTVNERVAAALDTDAGYQMVNADTFCIGDRWFYRAVIQVGERHYIGTAEIKFNAPAGSADHKNPIECAETSAVGRALGFAGFGVVDAIASADEVQRSEPQPAKPKPINQQPQKQRPATQEQLNRVAAGCKALGKPLIEVRGYDHAVEVLAALETEYREKQAQAGHPDLRELATGARAG